MLHDTCPKMNKIHEFYMIIARKIFSRIWGGGQAPPCPRSAVSYTPMAAAAVVVVVAMVSCDARTH